MEDICSRVVPLVVTFAIFIFTRPNFEDFFRSIRSVQKCIDLLKSDSKLTDIL